MLDLTAGRNWVLRRLTQGISKLPSGLFSKWNQLGIDAGLSAVSLYTAYQLRFDGAVPPYHAVVMWTWVMLLPMLRPLTALALGGYRATWRYFSLRDMVWLGIYTLPATCVMLVVRLVWAHSFWLAAIPISVSLIELTVNVLLATGARGFRRLLTVYTASNPAPARALVVGSSDTLAAVLEQVSSFGDLKIHGLIVPDNGPRNLQGVLICGFPVIGTLDDLPRLLSTKTVDVVLIADARLDGIGAIVDAATARQIAVRLLPTTAEVLRGDVRISSPKHHSAVIDRILIVGGAGYLGSALVPQLLARNLKVRVLDSLLFGDQSLSAVANHPNFELVRGDVRDIQAVVEAAKDCDAAVHLAAIVGDPACDVNKQLSMEINRAATRMLIDICRGSGVRRFLFASTCSVYGASDHLVDEFTPPAPISTYAESKVDSEKLLLEAASTDFHPTILRLGTLFGLSPRPRFDLVVNLLTARAATTGTITIYNGSQWRPFLHVEDAARAFVAALIAPANTVSGEIFNVGDYTLNLRLTDLSQKIAETVPAVDIQYVDNGDRRNYRASFDKIHTRLGFRCQHSLDFGIQEMYEAIRSEQIPDFTADNFNNHVVTRAFAQSAGAEQSSLRVLASLAQLQVKAANENIA
jgi:nucleoside-diphosphate-sugar epimerase